MDDDEEEFRQMKEDIQSLKTLSESLALLHNTEAEEEHQEEQNQDE